MRIVRQVGGGFLFGSSGHGDEWVSARGLGVHATDLAGVLPALPGLAGRVASATLDVHAPYLAAPVGRPGRILAVGLNYLRHIDEIGESRPATAMVFAMYPSAVTGPTDVIEFDPGVTAELDYEVELAAVVGRPAKHVDPGRALEHVLGYCVANDVSARDLQRAESQVSRSKGMDTFCPLGPWITTGADVPDPHGPRIRPPQRRDPAGLDYRRPAVRPAVPHRPLVPDRNARGRRCDPHRDTERVGSGMHSPTYLSEGDVVRCEIERLGSLENRVVVREPAR